MATTAPTKRLALGRSVRANLSTAELYEDAVRHGEGLLAADGPLVVRTGKHTGRSPEDKFIVDEPSSSAVGTSRAFRKHAQRNCVSGRRELFSETHYAFPAARIRTSCASRASIAIVRSSLACRREPSLARRWCRCRHLWGGLCSPHSTFRWMAARGGSRRCG